jgi:carbon monoxide dehydrogenase subunit G
VKVQGERSFTAPRETVWAVLNDPARMAKLMPGVESFDVHDEKRWTANVKIPLGLGGLRLTIDFEKTEERHPEFARLNAKGNGVGAILNMDTQFRLAENGTGTTMQWEADVRLAGPVGSMGQRVLQPIVNQQVQNVLTALEKQVAEAGTGDSAEGGGTAGAPEPSTDAPASTEPDLEDYGPPAEVEPGSDPAEEAGSSGAEEGIHEWSEEAYSEKPESS